MKIQFRELTIATREVERTMEFYRALLGEGARTDHHRFFYTIADGSPKTGVCSPDPDGRLVMLLYDDEI